VLEHYNQEQVLVVMVDTEEEELEAMVATETWNNSSTYLQKNKHLFYIINLS
jgi:hypothetical protein